MNYLFEEIKNKFIGKCYIEASKDSLKLEVIFYVEKEEKIKDFLIDMELFKYEEDRYLLEFLRTGGDLQEYYHNILGNQKNYRKNYILLFEVIILNCILGKNNLNEKFKVNLLFYLIFNCIK